MKTSVILLNFAVDRTQAFMTNFWGAPGGFMERRREKPALPAAPMAAAAVFDRANCRMDCQWDDQGLLWVPKTPVLAGNMSPVKDAKYETPQEGRRFTPNLDVVCSAMTSDSDGNDPLLSCTYCTHACVLGNEKILARTVQAATVVAYCQCDQPGHGNPGTLWYEEAVESVTALRQMAGELTAYV